ncbi:MAG: alpha/beta hydrolase [Caulobacter sp.]|nr:alpha/beta hydrolase [Caulobacter sp.]
MTLINTTRRAALFGAIAGGGGLAAAGAVAETGTAYHLPRSEVLPMRSAINGVDYVLYVRTPAPAAAGSGLLPVIVTLDADYSFPLCAVHLEHLANRAAQAPQAILVSVAYPGNGEDPAGYRRNRSRDYTPVFVAEGGYGPEYQKASGGGPAFLKVLTEEILPLIAGRYPADRQDATLVGHSFGGLFAAWVLETRPDAFARYLMVSPSLWYADRHVPRLEAAGPHRPLAATTRVYLGVGALEEQPGNPNHMVANLTAYAAALAARGDPNLRVAHRVFEDETHASIFPACFSTGLRQLFAM